MDPERTKKKEDELAPKSNQISEILAFWKPSKRFRQACPPW